MNFIMDKDREVPDWPRFWTDFKGQEYIGTQKELSKLKKKDKMNCRIAKIKKLKDIINVTKLV